jgi:mono/diheme cytochrome c family protein
VTEIPEHLLKRSKERRAALGLGDDAASEAPAAGATAATPAVRETTAPAPAAAAPTGRAAAPAAAASAPPARPDSPVVAAYKRRRRIPYWAMAALSLMPIWAFMYWRSLTEQAEAAEGPIGVGAEVYSNCASCHGGTGAGGVGYPFAGGEVLLTFPHIEDQLRYVYFGTGEYNLAGVEIYGNPEREGGPHITGARGNMPQQGELAGGGLTDAEILAVVCHERYTLGGADPAAEFAEEYERWCSEESDIYAALAAGEYTLPTMAEAVDDVIPVGEEPSPGSPPGQPTAQGDAGGEPTAGAPAEDG